MEITLSEHRSVDLPLETATIDALRQYAPKVEVQYLGRPGFCRVKAGSHVGTIVAPELELRIRPKCGIRNLLYLLSWAYRLAEFRSELVGHEEVDDVREFLLKILSGKLEDLLRWGPRRDYVLHRDDIPVLRGRLGMDRLARRLPGTELSLPCEFEEFTLDVPHNQVIRYTLDRIEAPRDRELRRRVQRLERAFRGVSYRPFGPADVEEFRYDRLNAHYESIHQLCRLFLEASGLEHQSGPRPLRSFLIDMNRVFEKFVAAWLKENLGGGLEVADQWQDKLDVGGRIGIRPDLLFMRRGEPVLVADTKYKRLEGGVPAVSDAYQVLAYCRGLGVSTGTLIYPEKVSGTSRFAVVGGTNTIAVTGVDLASDMSEIDREMEGLAARIRAGARRKNQAVVSALG